MHKNKKLLWKRIGFAVFAILLIYLTALGALASSPYPNSATTIFQSNRTFSMNETEGNNVNDTGNSTRPGYIQGTISANTWIANNHTNFSNSFHFDPATTPVFVTNFGVGSDAMSLCDGFAISFWLRNNNSITNDVALFGLAGAGGVPNFNFWRTGDAIRLDFSDSGAQNIGVHWGNYDNMIGGTFEWKHVVLNKQAGCGSQSQWDLYVNATNLTTRTVVVGDTIAVDDAWGMNLTIGARNRNTGVPDLVKSGFLIDDVLIFNRQLTNGEILTIYEGNYSGTVAPPVAGTDTVNISSAIFPRNNTQYNRIGNLSFNATFNTSYTNLNITLYINGTLNQTKSNVAYGGMNQYVEFNISFNDDTARAYNFTIQVADNTSAENSSWNIFFVDNVNPTIADSWVNNSIWMFRNITAQFNLSDGFLLFSYNATIDHTTLVSSGAELNTSSYSFNLSYDPSTLQPGNHTLYLRVADGHTAKELSADYDVSTGLFDTYINFGFPDEGEVTLDTKEGSILDEFTTERKEDRYVFNYIPSTESPIYTFTVHSDLDIHIIYTDSQYQDYLIMGNHWMDFRLPEEPNARVSIERIDDNNVEVTISNIIDTSRLSFQSLGDLNVITREYQLLTTNASVTFSRTVSEKEEQTTTLRINTTTLINTTSAFMAYNLTPYSATKTIQTGYDEYAVTFITPALPSHLSFNDYNLSWVYFVNTSTNITGFINNTQTVYRIGIDNCSTYNMPAINFSIRDESNESLVNGTIEGEFETWVNAINNFTRFNLTWGITPNVTGIPARAEYQLCIYPNESTYFTYAQLEYDDGITGSTSRYALKTYYFTNYSLDNNTDIVPLYLTTDTTIVKFTVTDQNDNALQGAYIQVLSYDVPTDSAKVTEVLKTDTDGSSLAQIVLNTKWYKFRVVFNNKVVLETLPTRITSTTNKLRVSIGSDYYQSVSNSLSVQNNNITFNNATKTFSMGYTDTSGSTSSQFCLEARRINGQAGSTTVNTSCSTLSSGILSVLIGDNVGDDSYLAVATVTLDNGDHFVVDTKSVSFNYTYLRFGVMGIFVSFLLIVTAAMIGSFSPVISIVLMMGTLLFVIFSNIFMLGKIALTSLIILAGIVLWKQGR